MKNSICVIQLPYKVVFEPQPNCSIILQPNCDHKQNKAEFVLTKSFHIT